MKILELTRSFYPSIGGMEKFVSDRLKIYERLGYDYQVITTTHSEKRIPHSRKADNVLYLQSYTPYEIVLGLKKIMETEYDILSVNQVGYFYSDYAISHAAKKNKKIILTPHFHFGTNNWKLFKNLHNNLLLPKTLEKIDVMISFTQIEVDYWTMLFPFLSKKIKIIPHYYSVPKQIKLNRNKIGKYLLYIGRGVKGKRLDLLLKAFIEIESDFHLVLTIHLDELSNELSNELKNCIHKNDRIHLIGRVTGDEKQNLIANCDALIFPTDFEAFGIVNFEASNYKKSLLLSSLPVFKNILKDEGVIYFENNIESIKKAIKQFLGLSENEKNKMGEVNFVNLQNYTFEKISSLYNKLFTELM